MRINNDAKACLNKTNKSATIQHDEYVVLYLGMYIL